MVRSYGLSFSAMLLGCVLPSLAWAGLRVKVDGVDGELKSAVIAASGVADYAHRAVSAAQAQLLLKQIKQAAGRSLRPYGYYQTHVKSTLQASRADWQIQLHVVPGPQVKVDTVDLRIDPNAASLPDVAQALSGLRALKGQPLNDGRYQEARDAVLKVLTSQGFLDAKLDTHQVLVNPATRSARIKLTWQCGPRYHFGRVRYARSPFRAHTLDRYSPFKAGDYFSQDQLLKLQQALNGADYFSAIHIQPDRAHTYDGHRVDIDVKLTPAKRTIYSGGPFYGTDTGAGLRLGMKRRWVNTYGHKWSNDLILSQRLKSLETLYTLPKPGPDMRSFNFGANYLDANTRTSVAHTLQLVANETRLWYGWTRGLGLKLLTGNFTVGKHGTESDRAGGLEHGHSTLLYGEASLSRKKQDDPLFVQHGWSLGFYARSTAGAALSSAGFSQLLANTKWIHAFNRYNRLIMRADAGITWTSNFSALPPQLRFFAGGDRSIRGYDYQQVGPTNRAGRVIGGRKLLVMSAEEEHYFTPHWGMAGFVDAGNAFNKMDYRPQLGVGLGVRWLSPVGLIRLDVGKPVHSIYKHGIALHVVIGPDL